MGFTRYVTIEKEIKQEVWDVYIKDCKVLLKHLPKHSESAGGYYKDEPLYVNGDGRAKYPILDKDMIWLNGGSCPAKDRIKKEEIMHSGTKELWWCDINDKDLGHETFVMKRKGFTDSCKTGRKPYDLVVTAFLILAKYHFNNDIRISGDGDIEDNLPALEWVKKYFPEAVMKIMLQDNFI